MKMIKKITISVIVLVIAFFFAFSTKVDADTITTSEYITVKGASVRTTGNQGLRFEVAVNNSFTGTIKECHVLIAFGEVTEADDIVAGATVHTQSVLDGVDNAGLVEGSYFVTLWDIPQSYYGQDVTARAYVVLTDNSVVYSQDVATRNLVDTARTAYSKSADYDENTYIQSIISDKKVKVTHSNGNVEYKANLNGLTLQPGDKIELAKGEYNDALTINQSNVSVFGVYAGILTTSSTRKDAFETVFKNKVTVADGVTNAVISGIKFVSDMALGLNGNNTNVTFKYNKVNYTGNAAIREFSASGTTSGVSTTTHSNINILKNAFAGSNETYSRAIYLQGYIGNINIESNSFVSKDKDALAENENCIKINKFSSGAIVNIMSNSFRQKSANYLVDLASSHTTSNYLNAIINIENNEGLGSSDGNEFMGNGFKITYVGTDSTINFIHNEKMRFSRYYNTILFSSKTGTTSSTIVSEQNPTIVIKYNKLYGDKNVNIANPGRSTSLSTNYVEMGLGFSEESSNITITQNYFSGTARGYSFATNSSTASNKNVYANGAFTNATALTDGYSEADTLYKNYNPDLVAFYTAVKAYSDAIENLDSNVNANYAGTGVTSILTYIPDFNSAYASKLIIQNGKLVYMGADTMEKLSALRVSVYYLASN